MLRDHRWLYLHAGEHGDPPSGCYMEVAEMAGRRNALVVGVVGGKGGKLADARDGRLDAILFYLAQKRCHCNKRRLLVSCPVCSQPAVRHRGGGGVLGTTHASRWAWHGCG